MQTFILFFKGLIIGIGKVIPGVSGSLLAISLGVYEKSLEKIENLFKNFNENIRFLLPLGVGIMFSVLIGSKILLYFFETYYIYTVVFFIGLILGTVPNLINNNQKNYKDWFLISTVFIILFFLYTKVNFQEFIPKNNFFSYFYIIFLGFIDALTMVMPGISGTATYMMLGSYNFILNLFSNPFLHIGYCLLFGIGLLFGTILTIKLVNFCFKKYSQITWDIILAFLLSSIFFLLLKIIDLINSTNLFSLLLLFIIGFFLISLTSKE